MKWVQKFIDYFDDPPLLRKIHGFLTILWIVLIVPSLLWWKESILWVVLMSAWANIAGHWSAWEAARAEEKADENNSKKKNTKK